MTQEEKQQRLDELTTLIRQAMHEAIKEDIDATTRHYVEHNHSSDNFINKWVAPLHGEEKISHYVIREMVKYFSASIPPPLSW